MGQEEDSRIILSTNTSNILKNNEICCLKPNVLSHINPEWRLDQEEGPVPLIFSPNSEVIDIIRCKDGVKVCHLKAKNVSHIKWFIPAKYLEDFPNPSPEEQLGIVWVDSNNVLTFYPKIFNPIKLTSNVVGLFSSYFLEDSTGNFHLSLLTVESDGNITRWVPFKDNSIVSRNVSNKPVKFISDSNVILELNNLKTSLRHHSSGKLTEEFGTSELLDKHLDLNRKLFAATCEGELHIIDSVNLNLIGLVRVDGLISVSPFVDFELNQTLAVASKTLSLIDLNTFEKKYEYSSESEEWMDDLKSFSLSEVLCLKVDLSNPGVLVMSSKSKRVYTLDTKTNNLSNFVNISTNRLYLFYYCDADNSLSDTSDKHSTPTSVRFGCVGLDMYSLVSFDLFKQRILYDRVSIPEKISIFANSHLQPNLLLASSKTSLMQLDIHYCNRTDTHTCLNNFNSSNNTNNTKNNNKINNKNNDVMKGDGKSSFQSGTFSRTFTSILTNNAIGVKKYPNSPRGEITFISFHPRLPNVSAIGCKDGSVFLFFLEFENTDLFEFIFVCKFFHSVKSLVWHLVPGGLAEECSLNRNNFLQRVWKSVYSSKYTSLLLITLDYGSPSNPSQDLKPPIGASDTPFYFMKLVQRPQLFTPNLDRTHFSTRNLRFFDLFIIQFPPVSPHPPSLFEDFPGQNAPSETDSSPLPPKYDNFSLVSDHLCLVYYSENLVLLELILVDQNLNSEVVKRFKISVKGVITNVLLTGKQYNQYHLFNNLDDVEQQNGHLPPDPSHLSHPSHSSDQNETRTNSNSTQHSQPKPHSTGSTKCINSSQQYLFLSTNLGFVYSTSLVHLFNNSSSLSCLNFPRDKLDFCNKIEDNHNHIIGDDNRKIARDANHNKIEEEPLVLDEMFISHSNILQLGYTILHSSSDFTPKDSQSCLCNSGCRFILAVGLNNLVLLYLLTFDHPSDLLKLKLFFSKSLPYSNFLLINEPFNYFKLLINTPSSLTSYSFK